MNATHNLTLYPQTQQLTVCYVDDFFPAPGLR